MSRKIKKSVSILLALVMLCGVLAVAPVVVGAEDPTDYTTPDGKGIYNLIPDEETPGMYELHLKSGEFNAGSWESNITEANILTVTANDGVKFTGNCAWMFSPVVFSSFTSCESIDLSVVNTSEVTNMFSMFKGNPNLTSLNIANFNTTQMNNDRSKFYYIFENCPNLRELTISENFYYPVVIQDGKCGIHPDMRLNNGRSDAITEHKGWINSETGAVASSYEKNVGVFLSPTKVTTFIWAEPEYEFNELADGNYELHLISGFYRRYSFQHGRNEENEVSTWNFTEPDPAKIIKITADSGVKFCDDCRFMFADSVINCTEIDLSNVDTTYATSLWGLFRNCENLTVLSFDFNTDNVTNMRSMFNGCKKLERLNVSGLNTENVENMAGMFANCSALKSLDLSNFKTAKVENMTGMFENSSALKSLDLSNFKTAKVENMTCMFKGCTGLESINVSGFDTAKVTFASNMFQNCTSLESLDLSSFDMASMQNAQGFFAGAVNLKEFTISHGFGQVNYMDLNNGEKLSSDPDTWGGWRIKGDAEAKKVSDTFSNSPGATILDYNNLPGVGETKTYIWINYYGVDWVNWDNTKLSSEHYKAESTDSPTYKGVTPTRPDSDGNTYTFDGWIDDLGNTYDKNADLPAVTRDTTYTAHYNQGKTEYTLNYIYQGRSGGNNGGYVGDDGASDTKTYTVTVELGESDLETSGMPKAKVLVDNAPVVNDPYKNCRWTFTDEYVRFDPENKVVTITANQPERLYRVELKNSDNSLIYTTRVKLNSFVQKDDSFITAPETDNSGQPFAYWSVVQNGKETARCFERRFNLRVTGDSVVTANYGEAENLISLSDAEITRQPIYQNGIPKDCLYADFITAYMDKQGMELSKKSSSEYKTGLILQYNKEILVKENEPGATLNANDKITFGSDYELTAADAKTIADGETVSGKYSYKSISIDNSKYNDKNRLNKALPIENTELNRRMVYCAYYYVYNVKAGKIEMTAPVYFYLYDKGNEINTEN